jgi:hypothetical protein
MAEDKRSYNVSCPKGYGSIHWVIPSSSTTAWCPVSGSKNCVECRAIASSEIGDDCQVKEKKQ